MRFGKFKRQTVHHNSYSLFLAKLLSCLQKCITQTIINIFQNLFEHYYAAINFKHPKVSPLGVCVHSQPQYY
jgi:hypothetical protein